MTWGWQPEPVVRLRPVMVPDGHGNQRPDWSQATTEDIGLWLYAPATQADDDVAGGRERGVKVAGTMYGPADAAVAPGDAVEFQRGRFRVVGQPQPWRPGTVIDVERWDG